MIYYSQGGSTRRSRPNHRKTRLSVVSEDEFFLAYESKQNSSTFFISDPTAKKSLPTLKVDSNVGQKDDTDLNLNHYISFISVKTFVTATKVKP